MAGKVLRFDGSIDSFKTKNNTVTIQLNTKTDKISLDKLQEISNDKVTIFLESTQEELIEDDTDDDSAGMTLFAIDSENNKLTQLTE